MHRRRTALYLSALATGVLTLSLPAVPAIAAGGSAASGWGSIATKVALHPVQVAHRATPQMAAAASPQGFIPCDVSNAYHLNAIIQDGGGKVIAIVDPFDEPQIANDLHGFDSAFGLPDPTFNRLAPFGTRQPAAGTGWDTEITLDVEWAHAAAPGATIDLVETFSDQLGDLLNGVVYATRVLNADVVSMGWGMPESKLVGNNLDTSPDRLTQLNAQAFPPANGADRPVTYVAAAGDHGFQFSGDWPAVASGVVGVGGTSVSPAGFGYPSNPPSHTACGPTGTPGVTSGNETVWGNEVDPQNPGLLIGTGGGESEWESRPGAQSVGMLDGRESPDVAMLADPLTGVAIFFDGAWGDSPVGGTGLSASMWAGIVARIDQARGANGLAGLNALRNTFWPYSAIPSDFNDITTGSAPPAPGDGCLTDPFTSCVAQAGYDQVSGLGSPLAQNLIRDLAIRPGLDIEWLGGTATSAPAVASWFSGRQDVFVRDGDSLLHKWVTSGAWSNPYENLGGTLTSAPAAVSWGPNRVDVFVRGPDNALWHKWWDGGWSDWQSLGGQLTGAPAVSSWAAGRLDVFVPGPGGAMFHKWWDGLAWSDWQNLGGALTSGPGAVSWDVNRVDVFARGIDGQMWHRAWNGSAWMDWEALGGALSNGVAPAPASIQHGQLDVYVFGQNPSNTLWHRIWNGAWGPWMQARPESWELGVATVSELNTGVVDIYVVDSGNGLNHTNF